MSSAIASFDFEMRMISHDNVRRPSSMSFDQQLSAAQTFCLSLYVSHQRSSSYYSLCILIQHSIPLQWSRVMLIAEPNRPWWIVSAEVM